MNESQLIAKLSDADPEVRCQAAEEAMSAGPTAYPESVLRLLTDSVGWVRYHVCGLLHNFGDRRAIVPLIERLRADLDPGVRGIAAYALGGIGCPSAIPALIESFDHDHEVDELGHTPSSCAATALDDLLGTEETRIRINDSLFKMPEKEPDLVRLKELALRVFQDWRDRVERP